MDNVKGMELKPSDFFIGVIDFFSVILPGALVAYFLKGLFYADVFGEGKAFPAPETAAQRWVIFLLATYIIGNIVFVIGSLLLDSFVYDKLLRNILFKKNFDLSYLTATAIRDQYLDSESWIERHVAAKCLDEAEVKKLREKKRREVINTFKWAQLYLAAKSPEILNEVRRLEADSKFFRSLVIAFAFIGGVLVWEREGVSGVWFFVLSILSLYRYGDLRYKSTEKAYEAVITLDNLTKPPVETDARREDNRTRFLASKETSALYQTRIAALNEGLHLSSELLDIPQDATWKVLNSSSAETLFCLRGGCLVKVKEDTGAEQAIALSINAIASLPSNSSFEIANQQRESLLLLSLK
jgi:hypothetical protein